MGFYLDNLSGSVYRDELKLIDFRYENDRLVYVKQYVFDNALLPVFFTAKLPIEIALRYFLETRVTPETRIGLNEMIEKSIVKYYNPERLIRYNKGRTFADKYWVDCEDLKE